MAPLSFLIISGITIWASLSAAQLIWKKISNLSE